MRNGPKEASTLGLHFDCDLELVSKQEQIRMENISDACVSEWREASGLGTLLRCGCVAFMSLCTRENPELSCNLAFLCCWEDAPFYRSFPVSVVIIT